MKNHCPAGAVRQHGAGIVETMVGILIGLIVVLVIYNVFALAEGYKRTAIGVGDAQVTGLFSQFVLAREIANGGNGISGAMTDLLTCNDVTLRPIPALITDGGAASVSDTVVVTYSTAPRVVWPVLFVGGPGYPPMAATSDPFFVQSPNGFRQNDRVIAMNLNGNCDMTTVTNNPVPDANGVISIAHPNTAFLYSPAVPATLLNMGQVGQATRTLFDVGSPTHPPLTTPCDPSPLGSCQLRSTDLLAGAAPNPVAQNIVLMKAQYGVDCLSNGVILWTSATASNICGDPLPAAGTTTPINYAPADVQAFGAIPLRRIRALRIGVVVRSDEVDLKDPALVGQAAVLFNCSTNNAACQGRIVLDNTVLADNYRYRTYETVVPLRNAIWN